MGDSKWFQWWCLNPAAAKPWLLCILLLTWAQDYINFPYVHSWARRHRCKCSHSHTHKKTHMLVHVRAHTHTKLIMKFHSSPVWKFFLIKFHLLQLGFHHPITVREAEALIHAYSRHQENIKACHLPSFISLIPHLLTPCFSSPVPFTHLYPNPRPHLISQVFSSPKISSSLLSHPCTQHSGVTETHCLA